MRHFKLRTISGNVYYVIEEDTETLIDSINLCGFIEDTKGWFIKTDKIESFVDITKEEEKV